MPAVTFTSPAATPSVATTTPFSSWASPPSVAPVFRPAGFLPFAVKWDRHSCLSSAAHSRRNMQTTKSSELPRVQLHQARPRLSHRALSPGFLPSKISNFQFQIALHYPRAGNRTAQRPSMKLARISSLLILIAAMSFAIRPPTASMPPTHARNPEFHPSCPQRRRRHQQSPSRIRRIPPRRHDRCN